MKSTGGGGRRPFAWTDADMELREWFVGEAEKRSDMVEIGLGCQRGESLRAIAQYDRGNTLFRMGRHEDARDAYREVLFGPVALAVAKDALEPKFDHRGIERAWQARKQEYLTQLAIAEPRALDICVADEIHACGSTITALRRLGVEYLRAVSRAGSDQTIWWYRSMLEILATRTDWPQRDMMTELRLMSSDLVRSLRQREEYL